MARKLLGSLHARVDHGPDGPAVVVRAGRTTPAYRNAEADEALAEFRILRSEQPEFEFGNDYAEYFDGLSPEEATVVYEGPLEADNERTYTYADRAVETGSTYCYWIAPARGEPTGPVAIKVRDPRVWWPYEAVRARMTEICRRDPGRVESRTIGRTVRGLPLELLRAGRGAECVAVVGAVHAGEGGPELALGAVEILLEECPELLERIGVAVIPAVNADEREREVRGTPWYLRTNAAGVDINRNFPVDWDTVERGYGLDSTDPTSATYRGPEPASEPETRAVMGCLTDLGPRAVFAFHCLASICGMGFITAREAKEDSAYAERCTGVAAAYIGGSGVPVPPEKTCGFVCTSGSLPAWGWKELGVPAFDLEICAAAEAEAYEACRRDRTDAALILRYQRLHADGLRAVLEQLAG